MTAKALEFLTRMFTGLGALAVFLILVLICVDVAARFLFNSPFSSTIEIVSYYFMTALAFAPLMALDMRSLHIDTDLFYNSFSDSAKRASRLLSLVITMFFYGLLAWMTLQLALKATRFGEVAMGVNLIPIWPARWILPIAFFAAFLGVFWKLIQTVTNFDPDNSQFSKDT